MGTHPLFNVPHIVCGGSVFYLSFGVPRFTGKTQITRGPPKYRKDQRIIGIKICYPSSVLTCFLGLKVFCMFIANITVLPSLRIMFIQRNDKLD